MDATKQDMVSQAARDAERSLVNHAQTPGFSVGVDGRTTRSVIGGQNDAISSGLMQINPAEIVASHLQTPAAEIGAHPEIRWTRTGFGGYAPVRGKVLEEAVEVVLLGGIRYNIRIGVRSFISVVRFAPPREYLPDRGKSGKYYWLFDILNGDWFPASVEESTFSRMGKLIGIGR